ncbi:organic cation transporter protein-like isoform X2 [Cylas formicarius]|uniref:organic cation transporter protein-like isoform X2 n=1 Tax=Cylas formicarius TaxID=197179 RepID=UPI002958CA0D|nr:organic cation transporter protein-like isoform X2 [Cylas formicarius]
MNGTTESVSQENEKHHHEVTDVVKSSIGTLGKWHIWTCLAIFLVKFPVAWHQLSIVFVAAPVNFSCAESGEQRCSANCSSHLFDRSLFTETIASEWDLVCEKHYLLDLAQTVTMLGILFGNMVFGYLSDKYGRKNPLLWAVVLQVTSGTIAAFSPWFLLFLLMRFLAALATGGTMVTSFVLTMELVGTKWRTILCILYQIPFNLGHLLLPVISYFLRDWRYFQAAISLPSLIFISYYWILPESPRWLLAAGKKDSAIKVLKKAAAYNNLATGSIENDVSKYLEKRSLNGGTEVSKGNILDLVRTPIMRMYTVAICFNWIVCGLCFFGVSQFVGQLGGNIFLNVALSAIIQLPSTFFACWSTKVWGRKKTLIFANVLSGTAIILIGLVPSDPTWIKSVLSTVGMFGLALAFPTVYIYSGELFPTMVRNVGVGTSSMCARLGSMVAPFVASLVTVKLWIPPVIFGVTPIIGALLCYKLPETVDCKLPDTVEEAEMFEKRSRHPTEGRIEIVL